MPATYKIHPGIGIARVGNSPAEFYLAPEVPAVLPTACDAQGNPLLSPDGRSQLPIKTFKDAQGRIKRQAARFQIYLYDEDSPAGRPIKLGDTIKGGGNEGVLVDIQWRVYLANKKAVWYEFHETQGEHGYAPDHPRRNADITDPEARQKLIIDPGPRVVNCKDQRTARFDRDGQDWYAPTFPPELKPHSIDTLGELKTDEVGRLLVLGGYGNSGTYKFNEFGQPRINTYANNDGWFDDTADGPVMARLVMFSPLVQQLRFIDVEYPAWVLVASPGYVPEILNIVTVEEVLTNLAIQEFADRTDLYGLPGTYDDPPQINPLDTEALIHWKAGTLEWNPEYKPWFYRDIWTILFRPDEYTWLSNVLAQSNFPHDQSSNGNFDASKLPIPPVVNQRALAACRQECVAKNQAGDLYLDALDPFLVLLDSQTDGTLRRVISEFDATIRALLTRTYFPAGTVPHQTEYQQWLDHVRVSLPAFLGDLLFHDLKTRLRQALNQFNQAALQAVAAPTPAYDVTAEPELKRYLQQWQAMHSTDSPAYTAAKDALQQAIEEIIAGLRASSIEGWNRLMAEADPIFQAWGAQFQQQQETLRQGIAMLLRVDVFAPLLEQALQTLRAYRAGKLLEACEQHCRKQCTYDPYRDYRRYLFDLLREPGEENILRLAGKPNKRTSGLPLMPLLAGDNPISNTLPSKFLRLTDYQLFLLRQWANGLFYNEELEGWAKPDPFLPYAGWVNQSGRDLDRGVLFNLLGGSFCPGGEVGWIIRNPAIYREPFRLKADPDFYNFRQTAAQANQQRGGVTDIGYASYTTNPLSQDSNYERGLQPGDLTKYMAVPWQADFNECSTQDINITYEEWNSIYPDSEGDSLLKREAKVWETMWWPAHRPLQTYEVTDFSDIKPTYAMLNWSRGIPGTNAGDLKMVTAWSTLGFVVRNPYETAANLDQASPEDAGTNKYISVERNAMEGA